MSARPDAAPGLLAAVRERVPARVAKRLDGGSNPADAWTWEAGRVTTEGGEVVTLPVDGPVGADDLACSCLLGPRCLHVLAVAAALPSDGHAPVAVEPELPAPPPEPVVTLDGGQRAALGALWRSIDPWFVAGAAGVDAAAVEGLRRGVHGARAVGLHRIARAGARVSKQTRDLQRERAEFELPALVDALTELVEVGHRLALAGPVGASWVGSARAEYASVGNLRLVGLCTEAVIAATGHAGVTTWLADAGGRLWSIADVRPGGPDRARAHYEAAVGTGGATLSHRELGRAGLFVQGATASPEGRLGSGAGSRAARSSGAGWQDAPLAGLWDGPLDVRLRRPLVCVDGVVLGAHRGALALAVDGLGPVRLLPATEHAELSTRENLALLARARGLAIRLVARRAPGRRALWPIAFGAAPGEAGLSLPEAWEGRCQLAFDRLVGAHVPAVATAAVEVALDEGAADPIAPLARRVARLALGGRRSLPGEARSEVDRERAALSSRMLPTAASALGALAEAACAAASGGELRERWLAAAIVARTVRDAIAW